MRLQPFSNRLAGAADYLAQQRILPRVPRAGESPGDYLYSEAVRKGVAVWELEGLAYMRPVISTMAAKAHSDSRGFLLALDEAAHAGLGHSITPKLVDMIDMPWYTDPVTAYALKTHAWDWAWSVGNYGGVPARTNLGRAMLDYVVAAAQLAGYSQSGIQELLAGASEPAQQWAGQSGGTAIKATTAEVQHTIDALENPMGVNIADPIEKLRQWLESMQNKLILGGIIVGGILILRRR